MLTATLEGAKRRGRRLCCRCGVWKPANRFPRCGAMPGGRRTSCHQCIAAAREARAEVRAMAKKPAPIAAPRCASCERVGIFVMADGSRACARCLKERVKERRDQ